MKKTNEVDQTAAPGAKKLPVAAPAAPARVGGAIPGAARWSAGTDRSSADLREAVRAEAQAWLANASLQPADRVSAVTETRPAGLLDRLEQVEALISREVLVARKMGADTLAVVVKPDDRTELFLQLTRRDGQLEAFVRCERGDFGSLNAHWPQLQESLAQQNVRLLPLREGLLPEFHHTAAQPFSPPFGEGGANAGGRDRHAEPVEELAFVGAPTEPARTAKVRSRAARSEGWETWA